MVDIAVEKLRMFCAAVSISGNRDDLGTFAPVARERRIECGPAAGMEAGLEAAAEDWALFVPVDVPGVSVKLLEAWVAEALRREANGVRLSFLRAGGVRQPTFCLLHRDCREVVTRALDQSLLKVGLIFERVAESLGAGSVWMADAETFAQENGNTADKTPKWFANLNTPEDLAAWQGAASGADLH